MDAQILWSQIFRKKSGFLKILEKVPKLAKNHVFLVFLKILFIDVYIFWLKLKQLHAVHNSVKTAYLGKIWFSNYGPKWYYSIRSFKYEYLKIGWTD